MDDVDIGVFGVDIIGVFEWMMLTLVCLNGCLYIVYADIDVGMSLAIPHK